MNNKLRTRLRARWVKPTPSVHVADAATTAARKTAGSFETAARDYRKSTTVFERTII
jgi:hypothetical protein